MHDELTISIDIRLAHLPGGGRSYAQKLLPELVRLHPRARWRVYCNRACRAQEAILRGLSAAREVGAVEVRAVRSPPLSLRQHAEFRRFRDDASLYHYPHFDLPLGMRGLPLVMTIHDLYPLTAPGYCSAWKRWYFRRLTGYNLGRAAEVITISEHSRRDILRCFAAPAERVSVVPQSHAPEYRPIEDASALARVRERYRLPERFILYTGNHKKHKNLPRLLEALARLRPAARREFPLRLTGAVGAEGRALQGQAERLGIGGEVGFLGWVEQGDLPALYNLASLAVLPSLYEGFGLASLEAMACGTPVACSNAAAIPEVVGKAGRLFDAGDVEAMAGALTAALEADVGNEQVRQGCLRQAGVFSVEKTARLTFEVYRRAASGGPVENGR